MLIKRRSVPSTPHSLVKLHPILQRIFSARGIEDEAQLDQRLQALLPFNTLSNIELAVVRLTRALSNQERILIVGDFDADGATSTALAVLALRSMGANYVDFLVPNRFEFGYGLTPAIIEVAKERKPHLIITVDNGISSIEGVDASNKAGIDVLVTDHHLAGEVLPAACAIVNPNQPGDLFPSKSMAGVGVIFYVMLALRRRLTNDGWFVAQGLVEPNMSQFLDLVALGTVADVVPLDQNNRILVKQGLSRIRQGYARPGIKALIDVSGRQAAQLRESCLGFAIAPRLNAAGRLDDMSLGIECLLSENIDYARGLAEQLNELNLERRSIEAQMKEQAMLALDKLAFPLHESAKQLPVALCLVDKTWHQGVIGILAGRLKERYHRPVIAFAVVNDNELKGSARSVAGLNIRDVLAAVERDNPGLITKFGGHAMAAGLSLPLASFGLFKDALLAEVAKHLDASECEGSCLTDGPLLPSEISLDVASVLSAAGPWGQLFPEPLFDNVFELIEQRIVGQQHLKLTLAHEQGGELFDAIAFNINTAEWPNERAKCIHAAYRLDINEFRGRKRLQLIIETMQVVGSKNLHPVHDMNLLLEGAED